MVNKMKIVLSLMIIASAVIFPECGSTGGSASDTSDPLPLLGDPLPADFPMVDPGITASLLSDASAPAYYVDSVNGSDDSDGRSPAAAWKTLDKLHGAVLQAGDVIRLARGSVWVNQHLLFDNNFSGTESSPIIVEPYGTGAMPVISRPRALWDKTREYEGIYISGTSAYITVIGISIEELRERNGIMLGENTHHITIAGCEIWRCGTGISLSGEHQRIISNYIHDIGSAGGKSGIGICFAGKDQEMGWNRLENCQARSDISASGLDGGAFEFYNYRSDAGYDFLSDNIRIHHNVVCGCLNFMEAYGNVTGMSIDYNVYLNGPNDVIELHFDDCEHPVWTHVPSYEVTISNNTFVPNKDGRKTGWGIIGLLVDWIPEHNPDPAENKIILRNNIFVTNYRVIAFRNVLGSSLVHGNNLYCMLDDAKPSNDTSGFYPGSTDILYDKTHPGIPGFEDHDGYDFRLSAGSAAVNAGTSALYTMDIMNSAVPAGGTPDIGAYEFR